MIGAVEREEVEAALPSWVEAQVEADVDWQAAMSLADVGGEVRVFLGTWCEDSRRELARLWRALDATGGEPGFAISYIAVDRSKTEPRAEIGDTEVLYVPTFVVLKEGVEVGRIIESSPGGIERDLLALLTGEVTGWVSGRDDLPASNEGG